MNIKVTLEQKALIKQHMELGQTSPEISKALGIKVRTVRKYVQLIKKGLSITCTRSPEKRSIK